MSDLHLISHHLCPYVQRAVIVLLEKDIHHERTYIDLANKPDWFAGISPLGRVPILQTLGTSLFESQVIAEYLDETTPGSLHPDDQLEKARHRSWIDFGSETLAAIAGLYYAGSEITFNEKRAILQAKFERIEMEIEGQYFAGDQFHMIDGVWGTIFRYFDVFDGITDLGRMADLTKLRAWRGALRARASIKNAVLDGYNDRLTAFLLNRNSYISTLMKKRAA